MSRTHPLDHRGVHPAHVARTLDQRTGIRSESLGEWRPLEIRLPDYDNEDPWSRPLLLVLDGVSRFLYASSILDEIAPQTT